LLCIDGFNIHNREYKKGEKIVNGTQGNNTATEGTSQSLIGSLTTKLFGVKNKKRPIGSVVDIYRNKADACAFAIVFRDPEKPHEPEKQIRYRTYNPDDCSEILAKIRFLKNQQVSSLSIFNNFTAKKGT
jgi:hypothetical protein